MFAGKQCFQYCSDLFGNHSVAQQCHICPNSEVFSMVTMLQACILQRGSSNQILPFKQPVSIFCKLAGLDMQVSWTCMEHCRDVSFLWHFSFSVLWTCLEFSLKCLFQMLKLQLNCSECTLLLLLLCTSSMKVWFSCPSVNVLMTATSFFPKDLALDLFLPLLSTRELFRNHVW